jgi:hypothetical protein
MRFVSDLFGRHEEQRDSALEEVECPHTVLVAHWDRPEDMPHEALVSAYRCQACGVFFTGEEGRALKRSEAERLSGQAEAGELG